MTIADRLTLIRAGYKLAEIKEMEREEAAQQHEQEQMEPDKGMEPQQDPKPAPAEAQPEAQEPGADPDPDPRDTEIKRLKQQLAAAQRANINGKEQEPYGMDDYIKDVFARK